MPLVVAVLRNQVMGFTLARVHRVNTTMLMLTSVGGNGSNSFSVDSRFSWKHINTRKQIFHMKTPEQCCITISTYLDV